LLAVCDSGVVGAALVGGPLLRLTRETVGRMQACGVGVVGIATAGDAEHLRRLGVDAVLTSDASPGDIAAALRSADRSGRSEAAAYSTPGSAGDDGPTSVTAAPVSEMQPIDTSPHDERGALIAVWGPVGAPGRTSVAVMMAEELAAAGRAVRLVDADTYGPSISQLLGLPGDDVPGLAAAARSAHHGRLDAAGLVRHLRSVDDGLEVMTGLARADRWPELRASSIKIVLDLLTTAPFTTVADIGFGIENDEELSFDTLAPRRHAAALMVLERADVVVATAAADPVSVRRLVHGLDQLREVSGDGVIEVVLNRVPARGGRRLAQDVAELLGEHGHRVRVHPVVDDVKSFTVWRAHGGSFRASAPRSPALDDVRSLLDVVDAGHDYARPSRRWSGRRAG
jgi:MinD-like ATPase involved in chromosome partitioning or flagellar assembly